MASQAELDDPLYNLRLSQANGTAPILTTSADTPSAATTTDNIAHATHITFNNDDIHRTFALSDATRFAPADQPLTLRSVYFAYLNKDVSLPAYLDAVRNLNEELPGGAGGSVQNLALLQRIELISWLQGEIETTDSLKALDVPGAAVDAEKSAAIASGKAGGVPFEKGGDGKKRVDARLMQIYDGERKMGNHNSVLRGSKPIV
jgi:parafibromin